MRGKKHGCFRRRYLFVIVCFTRPNLSLFPPRHANVVDELVVFRARWSMADRILKISSPAKTFLLNMIEILT